MSFFLCVISTKPPPTPDSATSALFSIIFKSAPPIAGLGSIFVAACKRGAV
jgi:hypothetical protein